MNLPYPLLKSSKYLIRGSYSSQDNVRNIGAKDAASILLAVVSPENRVTAME